LLQIAGHKDWKVVANQLHDFIAVTAAPGRVADEREPIATQSTGMLKTGGKCGMFP
jgi:hypothetical protein